MITRQSMTADDARRVVQHCFSDLISAAEADGGFVPTTVFADYEISEQREHSLERISGLRDQIARSNFDDDVQAHVGEVIGKLSVGHPPVSPPRQLDLMSGVARALVEQQRWFLLRLEDRLTPFVPVDPLFAGLQEPAANLAAFADPKSSALAGPTLGEAISQYLVAGKKRWTTKTHNGRVVQLRYLVEHLGADTRMSAITSHDVRSYRDAVQTLRANHGRTPKQSFVAKQTDNVQRRIAGKTASLIFEPAKAFFAWATDSEGMIDHNPARNVRVAFEKKPKGTKSRRPFQAAELETIFTAPIFTGCRSRQRRFEAGSEVIKDAKYWIPILGFYTGARLGELVQLHIGDVVLEAETPHISINENDETPEGCRKKHVKSAAGIRLVPLHPDLVSLGFGDFVRDALKRKRKAAERLFPEFPYGADGQASTVASKWFRRFLTSLGLTDPAAVFHSFRHGAEDAFRNAGQPQYVIDKIIGHADSAVSAGYGEGISPETALTAVSAMSLTVRLPTLWASHDGPTNCATGAV